MGVSNLSGVSNDKAGGEEAVIQRLSQQCQSMYTCKLTSGDMHYQCMDKDQ